VRRLKLQPHHVDQLHPFTHSFLANPNYLLTFRLVQHKHLPLTKETFRLFSGSPSFIIIMKLSITTFFLLALVLAYANVASALRGGSVEEPEFNPRRLMMEMDDKKGKTDKKAKTASTTMAMMEMKAKTAAAMKMDMKAKTTAVKTKTTPTKMGGMMML
jgi:hypothetical protein